jgi:hypothetical protein
MSQKGAGSKSSPYYKDKEGNLKYKKNRYTGNIKDTTLFFICL